MRVIAITSQKGGSGKTTLTGHLAVAAELAGHGPVALIDSDPQGSLAAWWNARESETPVFAQSHVLRLREDVERMRGMGIELLFIDTPPAITSMIKEVINVAELVVIPIRPSPHDLRAAGATVDMVEAVGRPLVFVINAAPSRARISGEAAVAMSQHGTVAPVTVHQRTEFAASMIDGRTVMEIGGKSRSGEEITQLWAYLHERLHRGMRRGVTLGGVAAEVPALAAPEAVTAGAES